MLSKRCKMNRLILYIAAAIGVAAVMFAAAVQNDKTALAENVLLTGETIMTDENPKTVSLPVSEEEWKQRLSPEQYKILRQKGTETPFTGKYLHHHDNGVYSCGACGNPIFASDTKFDSGSGWPSFDAALPGSVELHEDNSYGMRRVEVTCAKCGSHLGHVFPDGPTATGNRFCINSAALSFKQP